MNVVEMMTANFATTIRSFSRAMPRDAILELDGLLLLDAGPQLAMFNTAVLCELANTEQELSAKAATAAAHYRTNNQSWCFWICDGLLAPALRKSAKRILSEHRLTLAASTPGLWATDILPKARPLPPVAVRRVSSVADRASFCHIMSVAFNGPSNQIAAIYGSPEFWSDGFQGLVGAIDGRDVCATATVLADGVAGIYAMATLPEEMKKGYGEALLRHAAADVHARCGSLPLVLQSTSNALRFYRKLGFQQITNFSVYTND